MNTIIPYDKELFENEGAWISPDGKIIYFESIHEKYAEDFLFGNNKNIYDYIDTPRHKSINYKQYTGNLTKKQFEIFKLWVKYCDDNRYSLYGMNSDFLLYILGYDKVETVMRRCITTTSEQPHIRFYNYYLLDYIVSVHSKQKFDREKGMFISDNHNLIPNESDMEAEKEIKEIKSKVLIQERSLFLK